jgi:predicted component of type VI protein secretion system
MHGEPQEIRERVSAERRDAPFLLYRGASGEQVLLELPEDRDRLTIGRRASNDVPLPWDAQVSRVHAELVRMDADWVLCDEGVSHNGTFVNGERVRGRRRLRDGDAISVGDTLISFCGSEGYSMVATAAAGVATPAVTLTAPQRRVLAALCKPLRGPGYAAPASNQQIADELVVSVATVKGTLTALFDLFGINELPQNQKRAALATRGLALLD